jgi:hypothetical protein
MIALHLSLLAVGVWSGTTYPATRRRRRTPVQRKRSLFTYYALEKSLVVDFQLPSADYARIGELLLSRLVALSIDEPRK